MSNQQTPWTPALPEAPPRHFCTDCGLSRTANPKRCGQACQFIAPDYAPLVALVEPALAQGHKRLAVIGIPYQIYALRSIQHQLEREQGLERNGW